VYKRIARLLLCCMLAERPDTKEPEGKSASAKEAKDKDLRSAPGDCVDADKSVAPRSASLLPWRMPVHKTEPEGIRHEDTIMTVDLVEDTPLATLAVRLFSDLAPAIKWIHQGSRQLGNDQLLTRALHQQWDYLLWIMPKSVAKTWAEADSNNRPSCFVSDG